MYYAQSHEHIQKPAFTKVLRRNGYDAPVVARSHPRMGHLTPDRLLVKRLEHSAIIWMCVLYNMANQSMNPYFTGFTISVGRVGGVMPFFLSPMIVNDANIVISVVSVACRHGWPRPQPVYVCVAGSGRKPWQSHRDLPVRL